MADLIDQKLGQYQIIEQIGMGGMATVYKAYQASMDRYVAIKVLPRQLAEDPTFIGRFEQEARTIARLEHKHILPVYDFGTQDGYTYLVMRYVGTGTLKDLTAQGPLSLLDTVEFFSQLADALQYAHDHGVVHRDVKTSNVLTGEGRQCYLTDFGIAKLAEGSSHFTGSGTIVGTPAYMSPEQCSGLPVDARSDLYSLGIVLYEMLTGALPFAAETPIAVVLKQVQEPLPSPRNLNPAIPEAVEKVVFRALAKEPEHRYQSAQAFADALHEAVEVFGQGQTASLPAPVEQFVPLPPTQPAAPTTPVTVRHKRTWLPWAGAAAVAVLVAVIAGLVLLTGGNEQPEGAATSSAVPATSPTAPTSVAAESGWTIFTSTHGYSDEDRRLIVTDQGLWMSSSGGLVHWNRDGTSTKYTSANGLAYNNIQAMTMDSSGNLWLAGGSDETGVMRVQVAPDGTVGTIDYFDMDNSALRSSDVWTFLPEPDGSVLAGTYGSLIEAWNGDRWVIPGFPTSGSKLDAIGDRVLALARTKDGSLWAGGPTGLARLTGDTWQIVPPPEELQSQGYQEFDYPGLYADPLDGSLWVGLITQPEWTYQTRRLAPPAEPSGEWTWLPAEDYSTVPLRSMLRASDQALWMVGPEVVMRVDEATGKRKTFAADQGIPASDYYYMAEDRDGTFWLTAGEALVHYDGQHWTPYASSGDLPATDVVAMAEADDGSLWFVSTYGTVMHYADSAWSTVATLETQTQDLVVQGNVLWVATDSGLIRWEDGAVRRFTTADGLAADYVISLALDPTLPDLLWVGTLNGLDALDTAQGEIAVAWTRETDQFPGPAVSRLFFDQQGTLWVGTGYGLERTGSSGPTLVRVGDRTQGQAATWQSVASRDAPFVDDDWWVLSIGEDAQGNLWVGTDASVYVREGDQWRRYGSQDGAPEGERIMAFQMDGGVMWVATEYGGLYRHDARGWLHLGREGVGTRALLGLHRTRDGALWILTHNGIARWTGGALAE
jgi:ligand-binding sensor domain-containing protein